MEDLALTFPYRDRSDRSDQRHSQPLRPDAGTRPVSGRGLDLDHCRDALREQDAAGAAGEGAWFAVDADAVGDQTIFIEILHFPAEDLITPKDLQDILVVAGRTKRHITLEEEVAKRLLSLRNTHAITREWVRASALQGIITDGNGSTVYNLDTVFGTVPTVIGITGTVYILHN